MCQEIFVMFMVTASSGKPTPEIFFLPGWLRWTFFPKNATALHALAVDRTLNPPIERRTSHCRPNEISSPM